MPRQNRVTPIGTIEAFAARGRFMGNRGILHDENQAIVRPYQHKGWIICQLQFKGRRRPIMSPGCYTELFFLDEATALAAGHRPCFECRRAAAVAFREAWMIGRAATDPDFAVDAPLSAAEMDRQLHAERLTDARYARHRRKRTFQAEIDTLPPGVFITLDGKAILVMEERLFLWTPSGYLPYGDRPAGLSVTVLTPPSIVAALAAGYKPAIATLP